MTKNPIRTRDTAITARDPLKALAFTLHHLSVQRHMGYLTYDEWEEQSLAALRSLEQETRSTLPYSAEELETLAYRLERPHSHYVSQRAVEVLREIAAALRTQPVKEKP